MKITLLTDNTPNPNTPQLTSEHGLSMYIEHNGLQILCDMGLTDVFLKNANQMGISLKKLSLAFVSHGHNDHSGGLKTFLSHNSTCQVYLSPEVFHSQFFTSRHIEKRNISTDFSLQDLYPKRFHFISQSCWINKDIAIICCNKHVHPLPLGNMFLTSKSENGVEVKDQFLHELSIVFNTPKGLVICSSCSHNGALNIIESTINFTGISKIYAFVGGLHLIDCNKTEKEVEDFQKAWNKEFPDTLLYTGHCTSDRAKNLLKTRIKHIHFFYTGEKLCF